MVMLGEMFVGGIAGVEVYSYETEEGLATYYLGVVVGDREAYYGVAWELLGVPWLVEFVGLVAQLIVGWWFVK